MIVKVWYRSARLDVFDTQALGTQAAFGRNAILADMELGFDSLGDGLWLSAHYYDADPSYRKEGEDIPVARRKRGWRMLLAEAGEVASIERVTVDGEEALVRVGPDLVDAYRFNRTQESLLGYGRGGMNDSALAMQGMLMSAIERTPGEAAADIGFSPASLDWAARFQAGGGETIEEEWDDADL